MPATPVHGKGGSITFSGITNGIESWELNIEGQVEDATDFSDAGVKKFIAGQTSWSGSFSGNWDAANTAAILATGSCVFTVTTGRYYTGNVFITGQKISTPKDGKVTVTYDVQGTGALVPTLS